MRLRLGLWVGKGVELRSGGGGHCKSARFYWCCCLVAMTEMEWGMMEVACVVVIGMVEEILLVRV